MSSFFGSDDENDDIQDWNATGASKKTPNRAPASKPTLPAKRPDTKAEEHRGLPTRRSPAAAPVSTPPASRTIPKPATGRTTTPIKTAKAVPTRRPASRESDVQEGLQSGDYGHERQEYLAEELRKLQQSREEEKQTEQDEVEESKGKGRGKRKQTKPKKKAKGDSNYAGGRRNIVIVRWTIIGVFLILAGLGIKSVVAPPAFPSPAQILGVVDQNLGYTAFPRDEGNTFVLAFTELYLNGPSDPDSNTARTEGLYRYAPSTVVDQLQTNYSNTDWYITEGPFINEITYTDDENALFNVAARINDDLWIYIDVPVFYNKDTKAFAISGVPGLVSSPNLTEIPGWPTTWTADDEILPSTQEDMNRFFQAWGEPGKYDLPAYSTTDASLTVQQGLNSGAIFQSVTFLEVSTPLNEEEPTTSPREVRAEVVWGFPSTSRPDETGETVESMITYKSTYSLLIFPNAEDQRWRVQDIKAGIRSTTGVNTSDEGVGATPTASEEG